MSWHDAALGTCFQLGLDDETIRCDLPWGDFPLIELINLILFLNGSDFEVEEIPKSRHPAQAGTRRMSPAHPTPNPPFPPKQLNPPQPRAAIHGEVKAAGCRPLLTQARQRPLLHCALQCTLLQSALQCRSYSATAGSSPYTLPKDFFWGGGQ